MKNPIPEYQIWRKWTCKWKYCGKNYKQGKIRTVKSQHRVSNHKAKDGATGASVARVKAMLEQSKKTGDTTIHGPSKGSTCIW